MRVFITGGTGYLGSAVTSGLRAAGHEVLGLVRTREKAERLQELGAAPVFGDIHEPASLVAAAAGCEAVIHLAQASGPERASVDFKAVEAFVEAARDSPHLRALIYTSVLFVLGETGDGPAAEAPAASPPPFAAARAESERLVLRSAGASLVCAVLRPGMVYGGGAGGSVSELFRGAVEEGAPTYVGDGRNRWSLVHREDAAALYRLVMERRAGGIFHAVDGHPLSVREVAEEVSRVAGAGGRTKSLGLEEARSEMGSFADALCLDQVADATRALSLGWKPGRHSFLHASAAAFDEWRRDST